MKSPSIAIILLAAGASRRLGTPKQLVTIQEELLIHHSIQNCQIHPNIPVHVVLGAFNEQILPHLKNWEIELCVNENWGNGMMSSIQTGLESVLYQNPATDAFLVVLCDQYFVSPTLFGNFIDYYKKHCPPAIAATYGDTIGVPALFDKRLFSSILEGQGQGGAKKILRQLQQNKQLSLINFPKGIYDIDTQEQLEELKKMLLL